MSKLKTTAFSIILVLALVAGTRIFLCYAQESYQASVKDLSGGTYFPKVIDALRNAKSSIDVSMFLINFDPGGKNSHVNRLVEELVNARKRGVKVRVILDQNIDFSDWDAKARRWKREGKNDAVFVYLKKQGIEVYYDNLYVTMHGKAVVIDGETVILGSTNWTESSLMRNWENSCLIKSRDFAGEFLKNFSKITLDYEASILDDERNPPIRVKDILLADPGLAARMLTLQEERAFDLYLLLIRKFNGNPEGIVEIAYKDLYVSLGMDKNGNFLSAEVMISRTLSRLEKKYKLIGLKRRGRKPPLVILLDYPRNSPYAVPQEQYCLVPEEFWQYGWSKSLTFPEKYCYLINLKKSGVAHGCTWSSFQGSLIKEFNLPEHDVERGMSGLRKLNIIEIEYPDYSENFPYQKNEPTNFTLLGLYSPGVLNKEKARLANLYGDDRFQKARQYAEIVYKGNDIQVIEDIIRKIDEYGIEEVDKAFRIVAEKSPSNPKRSYGYVVGTLQKGAREKEE